MTEYSNILSAIGRGPSTGQASKLSPTQELTNYETFSDLQKQGVYLPDLVAKVKEVDELKRRLDEVEKSRPALDTAIFSTMEAAVAERVLQDCSQQRVRAGEGRGHAPENASQRGACE